MGSRTSIRPRPILPRHRGYSRIKDRSNWNVLAWQPALLGAKWGAIIRRRWATQSVLKSSISGIYQATSYSDRRQQTGKISFASR